MIDETTGTAELMTALLRACRRDAGIISPETNEEVWQKLDRATLATRDDACARLGITCVKSQSRAGEYYLFAEGEKSLLGMTRSETRDISNYLVADEEINRRPPGFAEALTGLLMTIFIDWAFDPSRGGDHLAIDSPPVDDFIDLVQRTIEPLQGEIAEDESMAMIAEACNHLHGRPTSTTPKKKDDRKSTKSLAGCCNRFILELGKQGLVDEPSRLDGHIRPTGKLCALYSVHIASRSGAYETIQTILAEKETHHA